MRVGSHRRGACAPNTGSGVIPIASPPNITRDDVCRGTKILIHSRLDHQTLVADDEIGKELGRTDDDKQADGDADQHLDDRQATLLVHNEMVVHWNNLTCSQSPER